MNFFETVGKLAIGSRLRLLTDKITDDAAQIYKLYGFDMHPKWFPVFYILSGGGAMTVTAIAKEIGHSHPSVSKIISEMSKKGLVKEKKDKTDGRRNMVSLSAKGKEVTEKIQDQYTDVNKAIEDLSAATRNDLWKAIEEWEFLLEQKTLLRRVQELKKQREGSKIKIVAWQPKYQKAFKELNEQWITTWFKMEEEDHVTIISVKDQNVSVVKETHVHQASSGTSTIKETITIVETTSTTAGGDGDAFIKNTRVRLGSSSSSSSSSDDGKPRKKDKHVITTEPISSNLSGIGNDTNRNPGKIPPPAESKSTNRKKFLCC